MTNTVVLPKRKRRPVDKTLPVIMTLLLMMGLVTLFSATYYNAQDGGDALSEVKKQLFGMAVGFAAMLFTSRIPYWFWGRHRVALAGLGLSAVLLVLVIIPGVGVYINGSRRWLRLGPLSFQPSELAKYAVVLFVALALAARGKRVQRFFTGILPVLIAPGVMFLLMNLYAWPMMVTYELKFTQILRNSLVLAIGRLPQSVLFGLITIIPIVISGFWLPFLFWYFIIGYALASFVNCSYTNAAFDRFFNTRIEGAEVGRGMQKKAEDDDEWEDLDPDEDDE